MEPNRAVAALVAAGRLEEAAQLCATAGDHEQACELYERACCFAPAAVHALAAGAFGRALQLGALAGDATVRTQVMAALDALPPQRLRATATELLARGQAADAGSLLERAGDHLAAASAFERAGRPLEAAAAYDRAGKPADAARTLEAALRDRGGANLAVDDPVTMDELRCALGQLYARHGRHEPAVRVLQQIAPSSQAWPAALPALAGSLSALGLTQALRDLEPELRRHGVAAASEQSAPTSAARDGAPGPEIRLYGRYQLTRDVASTPHARVVEAVDLVTGERVAIKIFASQLEGAGRDALQRFVREARALGELRHPNVVPLREFVPEGPALVLPWMAGGSLRELLDREPISAARAAEIERALLGALGEAHRLGILHRDVKPSNLMFDAAGTPMLGDFGAAHLSESAATVTAAEIGTVAYMAPEQIRGQAATVQSDLFSAGVLLFEMLTGERPTPKGPPQPSAHHPDLDARHDQLLARFLAERPGDRFTDALQARRALEALPWSTRAAPARPKISASAPTAVTAAAGTTRLGAAREPALPGEAGHRQHDAWLDRDVIVLRLDEPGRARAAAFARAGHPALPAVLRIDADAAEIWIAPARGRSLHAAADPLDAAERRRLGQALAALHRAGGVHGCIDAEHVFRHAGAVSIAWPARPAPAATADDDLGALQRLP